MLPAGLAVNIFPRLVSLDKQKMFSLLLRKLQMFCQHIFLNHLQLHFNHHHRLHLLPFSILRTPLCDCRCCNFTKFVNSRFRSIIAPSFSVPALSLVCLAPLPPALPPLQSPVGSPRMHMKHVDFLDSNNKSRNQILFPMFLNICTYIHIYVFFRIVLVLPPPRGEGSTFCLTPVIISNRLCFSACFVALSFR